MTLQLKREESKDLLPHSDLRIKMFIHNQPEEAERSITHWLKQNDITIRHITQSQSEKGGNFVFIISVFFQQNN